MARIIKTLIQKRVSDIDMFQHVNNVSQQMYFDVGKMEFYEKARRSVHAAVDIPEGTVICEEMLCVKRPGYGIRPKHLRILLGKMARRQIEADQWITWDMF